MKPIFVATACMFSTLALAREPERLTSELAAPVQVRAGDRPLDVGRSGHAAPCYADLDGDGVRDLLVGQFDNGRLRIYCNLGTNIEPKFGSFEWFMADGKPATVPVYCCIGFTPQLADLDGDGRTDVLAGSAPGDIYLFRRLAEGTFAAGEKLCQVDGNPVKSGNIATAHAVDWNGDGRLDLLLGNVEGQVHVALQSSSEALKFDTPIAIKLEDAREELRDSAPVAADWNHDGRFDLIVGMENGSVYWFRNTGEANEQRFAPAECLVPERSQSSRNDSTRTATDWGYRSKPWVTDFNGDGLLDLLMGDCCGSFTAKPDQTPAETAEEQAALKSLPDLRQQWTEAYQQFRQTAAVAGKAEPAASVDDSARKELLNRVKDLKTAIESTETTLKRYQPCQQTHGFVWLFLRRPEAQTVNQSASTGSGDENAQ